MQSTDVCAADNHNHTLVINGEHARFECATHCYSAVDVVTLASLTRNQSALSPNHVPYVYADALHIDGGAHNVSLLSHESWADGLLGLSYNFAQKSSLWQLLGTHQQHSRLLALDPLRGRLDVGEVHGAYTSAVEYSESIWWRGGPQDYHYFYIYSLSLCDIDVFAALDLGAYYLGMLDTGASCLTLPPEMFDVLFRLLPHNDCDGSFCYVSEAAVRGLSVTFGVSLSGERMRVPLSDLLIAVEGDAKGVRLCVERGSHSVDGIAQCAQNDRGGDSCTSHGLVVLGAMVLRSLYTVLDFPNKRLGFANNALANVSESGCVVEGYVECVGEDVLNRTANVCASVVSECEEYWAWTYGEESHECVLHGWLYGVIPLVWLAIMAAFVVFVRLSRRIDSRVYEAAIKV